jgi:SNF2 family DNA or RNA helicase
MWFEICKLSNISMINSNDKVIMDCHERLRFINTKSNREGFYTYDAIINIIIHYYYHTKNIKVENRFINIDNNNCIFINTNLIKKYKNEPIFNAICSLYHRKQNEFFQSIPDIENLSIPSVCSIDKKIFTKEKNSAFNVKLFEYQKKAIMRMIEIENNKNMYFVRSSQYDFNGNKVIWDPHYDMINDNNTAITKVKSNGGILSDTMGLGKTITAIGLMHYGPTIDDTSVSSPKTYSRATLVIVPSHLAKQWVDEYLKAYNASKKIVVILTKTHHDKITYQDIIEADIVIVTIQFILNIKNYCAINYNFRSIGTFDYDARYQNIIRYHFDMLEKVDDYLKITTKPLFECFHFNRVIIDEGHEIMEQDTISAKIGGFINHFIKNVDSSYKWYISGTPFTSYRGLKNIMSYLGIEFIVNNENMKVCFDNSNIMNNFIINNNKNVGVYSYMSNYYIIERFLQTIMIRHLKEDVKDSVKLLGYEEQIEWIELSKAEKSIYDSKVKERMNSYDRRVLQQICCHPLIAESYKKIIGNDPVSLDEVQDKLIEHHTETIKTYTNKIDNLDKTNQAYSMLLSKYKSIITESTFILKTLEKINENIDFNEDENCIICYENMEKPILTPCGHMFCNNCIQTCLKIKPECPMCKHNVTHDTLIDIKKKKETTQEEVSENTNPLTNPLVHKYGSKLGKLIQMTRTLLSQDARIIIFSQWDDMLTLIGKSMGENGIDCSFISGNVYCRNKAIKRFKMGGNDNSVILLSLANSASGTNLTEATHIIIVEPIDETKEAIKAIEGQAIGRAVRLGQKQVIKVIRILCKATIEEEIYNDKYIS